MHVTIVQLTRDRESYMNFDADEVFAENEDTFDYVDEHIDDDREDYINTLIEYLGNAATSGTDDGVRWIEIDRERAVGLFVEPFHSFLSCIEDLKRNDLKDFSTGVHDIETKMCMLDKAYHFGGIYVIGEHPRACPVSDWLRYVINDADAPTRYYIRATYDGHQ